MRQFVASQAPRLAHSLVTGEPCAVCGSTEHPAPAKADGEKVADYDTVTAAQAKADQARDSLGRIDSAITGLVEQLGADAQTPPEVLAERQEAARATAASADTAVARLSVVRAELSAMESTLAAQQSSVSERKVEAATSRAVAEEKRAEAGRLAELCVDLDPTLVAGKSAVIDRLGELSARMASVTDAVTTSAAHVEFADSALGTALEGSGFDSVDEASSVVLDEAEEARRRAAREEWQTRYLESTASLGALEEQGVPAARPDTATLEQRAKEASEASDALASMRTTGAGSIATASARLDEAESVAADSAELRERYDTVRRAFSVCNGESPRLRVKLERWVLAHELDRVTRQANVHLERMTNHRFRLQRSLDSGQGLTLEVVDAHTGRQRATASLSGGEQFQASLALALGLADVISHGGTASGKQFEALFVDEGFGSLDPVALEQAIDALSMIQAAGRMVGAITHVEGMKERLHVGIEVSRLPGDRGSTLTVHP
jgi:exonuclease SbcC